MSIQVIAALLFVLCLIGLLGYGGAFARRRMHKWRPKSMRIKEAYSLDSKNRFVVVEYSNTEYILVMGQNGTVLLDKIKTSSPPLAQVAHDEIS